MSKTKTQTAPTNPASTKSQRLSILAQHGVITASVTGSPK